MKKIRSIAAASCVSMTLCSCATPGEEPDGRTVGTILGTIAGALIGSQLGSGAGRAVAILVGAGVGAVAGNFIGGLLSESDRKAVTQTTAISLNNATDGQSTSWRNPAGKAAATITPTNSRTQQRQVAIARDKSVASPSSLDLIGSTFKARGNANIRRAPNTNADIAGRLVGGEEVHVVGKVTNENWYLVSRNNRSIGYVFGDLLAPAPAGHPTPVIASTAERATSPSASVAEKPPIRPVVDLDASPKQQMAAQGVDLDTLGDNVVVEKVSANTRCRDVTTQVTAEGKTETNKVTACRGSDGVWEIL